MIQENSKFEKSKKILKNIFKNIKQYLCMVHDLVLAAEGNRTLGTFEEAREEIVVNVRH